MFFTRSNESGTETEECLISYYSITSVSLCNSHSKIWSKFNPKWTFPGKAELIFQNISRRPARYSRWEKIVSILNFAKYLANIWRSIWRRMTETRIWDTTLYSNYSNVRNSITGTERFISENYFTFDLIGFLRDIAILFHFNWISSHYENQSFFAD